MKQYYVRFGRIALFLVYLVILAGAVVRMTGSGMGCPDWPKCFGYLVPPTEVSQLEWAPGRSFEKGQVIILDKSLWLARADFQTGPEFNPANWEPYTRHSYAVFNAAHTWTEYVNRLLGALSGLTVLGMAICSLAWWHERKSRVLFAWLTLIAIGFQGWLGATVVYSVLAPVRITIHMFMALVIVAMLTWINFRNKAADTVREADEITFRLWAFTALLSLVQIMLGTQVRQFVDHQSELPGGGNPATWLTEPNMFFYVHRSFSILVIILHLWVAYRIRRYTTGFSKINAILLVLTGIILSGLAMNYLDFPFGSQAVHLVLAAILFGLQFHLLLELRRAIRTHISS